jgi:hypothetical protein
LRKEFCFIGFILLKINQFHMKKISALLLLLSISYVAFSQFDPATNHYGKMEIPFSSPGQLDNPLSGSGLSGVTCTPNTFWAVYGNQIYSFTLNNNILTENGLVGPAAGGSLAFCNNLDGGSYSPTFYSNSWYTKAAYYNGSGWTTCAATPKWWILNAGGNGNYLYYTSIDSTTHKPVGIARYNGSSYNSVYSLPDTSRSLTVADLAVDDNGNVWFFTGNPKNLVSDTLHVISPTGQFIKKYPFLLNTDNAYGFFMLNSILYLGLGSSNPDYPNTLIPITISNDEALAGDPIAMPAVGYADLASCNAGSPFTIGENSATHGINVYPNPAKDILHIDLATNSVSPARIRIYAELGMLVFEKLKPGRNETVDISGFPTGIYFLRIDNNCLKFIKQ